MEFRPEYLFFGILLLVPAQFLMSPSETGHLKYHLNSMIYSVKQYIPDWMWSNRSAELVAEEAAAMKLEMDPKGNGAYGLGQYVRQRAPEVEFRVGDVVFHEKLNFRGVIVGWDQKSIAPEDFAKVAYKDHPQYLTQPNYAVLIDTRDRFTPQLTYVPQENIRMDKATVIHPLTTKFFDGFDEKRQKYILRPMYKTWYPDD